MSLPFPDGPIDKDVFFHNEMVCIYHESTKTWECRRVTPQDAGVHTANVRRT